MNKRILIVLASFLAFGCLGGEDELATVPVPKKTDTLPAIKLIQPGTYTGDYAWIDSNRHELESEFTLEANGSYRLFWISSSEAVYDQRGIWAQKDSNVYFRTSTEAWINGGVFSDFTDIEDDTSAITNVTANSFIRREYTPLRQKPYWITYTRQAYPTLSEGRYKLSKTFGSDSDQVSYLFKITLGSGKFDFSYTEDTLETYQSTAKYYQIGSFLVTEENQQREIDSTNAFPAKWEAIDGTIMKRLQAVSDTAFNMWSPESFFELGSWDHYGRH